MPSSYFYSNPADENDIVEVIQSMNDTHEYYQDGVKWDRVWQNPQLNVKGGKVDPFDKKKFIDKTGKMKGTYGDMLDFSKELSEERAAKLGEDPMKRKHFDDYEKKVGKKHLLDKPKSAENDFMKVDYDD